MRGALKLLIDRNHLKRSLQSANAGLWLDKYIGDQARRETRPKSGDDQDEDESRRELVKQVSEIRVADEYKLHYQRWRASLEAIGAECREATEQGRLSVGLGGEGVLETSITLHRTYGVPFIPGSALKGLAAGFAHKHLSEEWKQNRRFHRYAFGNTDSAGYVTFFDALLNPEAGGGLVTDVLTVHHKEYYEERSGAAPADWDSPTPVPFLSAIGSYLIALSAPPNCDEWLTCVWLILEAALRHSGVGAKTSSGYGRLKLEMPPPAPGQGIADDLIKQIQAIPTNQVAGMVPQRAQELNKLQLDPALKRRIAEIILAKVRQAGREKAVAEKPWFKELLEHLKK